MAAASFAVGRGSVRGQGAPGDSADAAATMSALAPRSGSIHAGEWKGGSVSTERSVGSAGVTPGNGSGGRRGAYEGAGGGGVSAGTSGGGAGGASGRAGIEARYAELRAREEALARDADRVLARVPSLLPVEGARVSSTYTSRRFHPVLRRVLPHRGVDFAAPHGAPVRAAADGVVLYVVRHREYGLLVDVAHGERFITRYAHLSSAAIERGDTVRRGETIGRVGSSGLSTGPHLHYETFVNGRRRDPIHFLGLTGDLPDVP